MSKNSHYEVWSKVPPDYYQKGIKKNFLQRLWHTTKINLIKKTIRNLSFNTCLDVGCASGFMISEIAKEYPRASYSAIDVYSKAIEFAKKKYPNINFKIAQAEKMPYKGGAFDLIIFCETIEHVEDPLKALLEIKRVLAKRGRLIITMDSGSWLFRVVWFFWENTTGKVWKEAHLHPFKYKELEKLILKAGFKIKKKVFSFFGMEVTFIVSK